VDFTTSADTGSGQVGANLDAHATGNPVAVGGSGSVTVGHTWLIVIGALALLWLLGGVVFKSVRM